MCKSNNYNNVIDDLSIGVVIADSQHRILYHNVRFSEWFGDANGTVSELIGRDFYRSINSPNFLDGCFAPFYYAQKQTEPTRTILTYPNEGQSLGRRFEMLVSAMNPNSFQSQFRIELKEISAMNRFEQRLNMLRTVGNELAFFTNEKLHASEDVLKDQLKMTIENQMRRVLNYDVFEIRTLNPQNNELVPFLAFGMDRTAATRRLYVKSNDNGITGFVASSREAYICNDAKNDPLYLNGAINAKSSITVPLLFNNEVIGVCNVESAKPNAFSSQDLVFLELYAKDLAFAIHLLEYTRDKDSFVRQACNRLLHHDLDSAFHSVLEDVCETASAIQRSSLSFQLSQKVERLVSDSYELREMFENSTQRLSATPVSAPKESFKEDFPSFTIEDQSKWDELAQKLSKKKALLISLERQTLAPYGSWLKRLGCRADYVNSSQMAITSLKHINYDFVICERTPDGSYFPPVTHEEAHDKSIGSNEFGFSRYDVHEGDRYFVPAPNNAEDQSERLRVHREIEEGKLDAYFLLKQLYELSLFPLFILATDEAEHYDPTHVRPNVNKLRRSYGYSGSELTIALMTKKDKVWKSQRTFFKKLDIFLG